uniref:Head-tail joining protein n=1 Tax=viral metagenome TaxID=1070528 RepID=A0A6M3LWM0_9ZZZZ
MINAYCVEGITVLKWNGNDEWGEPIPATEIVVRGQIEYKTRLVRNIKGEEVASQVMIRIPKNIDSRLKRAIYHEDRIKLENESFDRSIIAILQPKAFSKSHYEVYLS